MAMQLTDSAGVAAPAPPPSPTFGRATARGSRRRRRPVVLPYALIAPSLAVIALMLGYPLFRLAMFSLEEFGLRQQFGAPANFVGFRNFGRILSDSYFWDVLWRTIIFCAVNVALTMLIGLLVALLLRSLARPMRLLVSTGLLLAWAMPALTATVVWQWLFDTQYGFVNWLVTRLGGHYEDHAWLTAPFSFFTVATIIVVWMGVPFVAFTLYAGTTQVPREILEAASIDGAGPWARFRYVMLPVIKPLLLILTALSVL
jgi:N,N'-diacetylchitobiose transport system permease protein